jgi:hypothetical protein
VGKGKSVSPHEMKLVHSLQQPKKVAGSSSSNYFYVGNFLPFLFVSDVLSSLALSSEGKKLLL